ncbi:related to protein-L-isoaspartate(D-aspartate) O-methyltransferase [Phialocephala subalpina]|uniref:protein-L-isoaspartate(D-aspartate) O-methyltransferase n=1 Tax=Phialocephala subalpina TaxID=576137 RepID=A0A1L7WXF3_9HELO|nr:related to protein-L-isoaspartate(D-aspartate) O-methyltransferase [Phialocephala subalpina]
MAWRCSGNSNSELIENLFKADLIHSPLVKAAMMKVDRAHYCPDPSYAYEDSPQSIGHAATISAPHMHAHATESLLPHLKPGSRVLDIGSGSGYLTAVIAELVHPQGSIEDREGNGKVVGLEHIKALRDLGEGNMKKGERGRELLGNAKVSFVVGDGRKGWVGEKGEEKEGWDAIHVGAAAVELHQELIDQLRSPGRIFIPVEDERGGGQYIWTVDKDENGVVTKKRLYGVRYVPLTDAPHA